jgi:glyoxylase I family protein
MPKLHHVSVRVRDVERSRQFYEHVLGVAPTERPDLGFPGMWYRAGSSEIHLIGQERLIEGGVDPSDPHFALEVSDLSAVRRTLDAAAIPTATPSSYVRPTDADLTPGSRPGCPRGRGRRARWHRGS